MADLPRTQDTSLVENDTGTPLAVAPIEGEKILKVFDISQNGELPDDDGTGNNAPFKKISYASELKNIQKGGENKISIRPRVLIENLQDDQNLVDTLEAGTTDVGQIFRLSAGIKKIDRLHLCLEAVAAGGGAGVQTEEDFESYADTAALRAVWVGNDLTNSPNTLETTIVQEGSKAMKCDLLNKQKSKNDTFIKTYGSNQDWSGFEGIQFQLRQDGSATLEIRIEDAAGNISKHTITTGSGGVFEFQKLDFANFVPVAVTPADLATIKKITFFVKSITTVGAFYVDIIELFEPSGGSGGFGTVDIELHDFGTDSSPSQLSTILKTEALSLSSGKQIYELEFEVEGLTPNNFYGIVITNASDSDIKVFGKSGGDLYASGFAFNSANDLDITELTNDDLCFSVFAVDKSIFNGIRFVANAGTGEGKINVFINDNSSGKGKLALFLGETFLGRLIVDFPTKLQTGASVRLSDDDLVFITFFDDSTSLVTKLQATVYFTFINRPLNG